MKRTRVQSSGKCVPRVGGDAVGECCLEKVSRKEAKAQRIRWEVSGANVVQSWNGGRADVRATKDGRFAIRAGGDACDTLERGAELDGVRRGMCI